VQFPLFVLYFVAGMLALEGLSIFFRRRGDPARVRNRLRILARRVAQIDVGEKASILRNGGRLRLPSLAGLEKLLYQAGGSLTVARFIALSAALGLGGFWAIFMLTGDPYRSLVGLLVGLVPRLSARRAASKRTRTFAEQLPDALELITRCLRTGHALGAGFQMVGEELADPIGTEFGLVSEEIRMGLQVGEALDNLMSRVDNDDLPYFTTAVMIQRQTGGNLAELLDKLCALLRERFQFKGRVHAMTAQGRGAATFLALWMPGIVVLLWFVAPAYLAPLIENDWGNAVLAGAAGIDLLAYYLALRIADVEA
jgi:tight adherence protein B